MVSYSFTFVSRGCVYFQRWQFCLMNQLVLNSQGEVPFPALHLFAKCVCSLNSQWWLHWKEPLAGGCSHWFLSPLSDCLLVFFPCGSIEVVCQSTTLVILEKVCVCLLFRYKVWLFGSWALGWSFPTGRLSLSSSVTMGIEITPRRRQELEWILVGSLKNWEPVMNFFGLHSIFSKSFFNSFSSLFF